MATRFRWLVEEFRVSLFAQELGTAEPVSAAKLDRLVAEMPKGSGAAGTAGVRTGPPGTSAPTATPPKRPPLPDPAKKSAPLKNLSALDNLFRR